MDIIIHLSTSDQYRRPPLNANLEANKGPLALNFSRNAEAQRKESIKKNKSRVGADVVRYQGPRRSSSSDSSDSSPVPHDPNGPPQLPPKQQRKHSHNFEESLANISADNIDVRTHMVLKPKPNPGHVYENIENLSHTPVQSGLATLPRNKKSQSKSQNGQHSRQGSTQQDPISQGSHSRQSSTTTLTESHSRQSSTHTLTDHSRQNSAVSQHSEIIQQAHHHLYSHPSSAPYNRQMSAPNTSGLIKKQTTGDAPKKEKPPKPAKPEKKSSLSKKKVTQPPQEQPPPLPEKKKPRSPPLSPGESYIDRKMVESVLKYQTKLVTTRIDQQLSESMQQYEL